MANINVPLLAHVRVAGGTGIVRFVGQTGFAAGKWVGIELDTEGAGKNDGTLQVDAQKLDRKVVAARSISCLCSRVNGISTASKLDLNLAFLSARLKYIYWTIRCKRTPIIFF